MTLELKVDILEKSLRSKLETDTGFADEAGQAIALQRVFKHFDTDNSGYVDFREFVAALVRLNFVGVQHEVKALFERYDADGSGFLDYGEFCGSVFGLLPSFKGDPNSRSAVERVRAKIAERGGLNGIRTLGRILRTMDDNGNGKLDKYELEWGLRDYGMDITGKDLDTILKAFDRDGDGQISFDELLRGIRGKLNARRRKLILLAFDVLDKDGSGEVTISDVAQAYNAKEHPLVKEALPENRAEKEAEVLAQFMDQWDGGDKDGVVTVEEFLDYYKDVSASIDEDDYFELMIRNAWHISGGEGVCENTANKRVLVVHYDGSQEIVEIKNDMGLDTTDKLQVTQALKAQGVRSIKEVKLAG